MLDYMDPQPVIETLDASRSALVVIDLQYGTASRTAGLGSRLAEERNEARGHYRFTRIEKVVVPNTRRLLDAFRESGALVCYLTVGSKTPTYRDVPQHRRRFIKYVGNVVGNREHEILDEVQPAPTDVVFHKTTTGGFNSSGLDSALRARGIDTLIVTGVSTNSCVETTARGAADRHYRTIVVEDACGAAAADLHDDAIERFGRLYGPVLSTGEVVARLR